MHPPPTKKEKEKRIANIRIESLHETRGVVGEGRVAYARAHGRENRTGQVFTAPKQLGRREVPQ